MTPPAGCRLPLPAPPPGVLYDRGCRNRPRPAGEANAVPRPGRSGEPAGAASAAPRDAGAVRRGDRNRQDPGLDPGRRRTPGAPGPVRRTHPRPGRPDRTGLAARRPHRAHGHRLLHGRRRPRQPGRRPRHVQQRPRHPGRPHVGRGGEGGPDPGPDADLHLRLTRQDPGNPQHHIYGAAVRPGDHGRGTPHRRPPGQEVGRRPRQPAHPGRPPPLHDRHPPHLRRPRPGRVRRHHPPPPPHPQPPGPRPPTCSPTP